MPKFVIALRNEKLRTYTVISWLIIALNFVSFLYLGVTKANHDNLPYFAAGLLSVIFFFRLISSRDTVENDSISLSFSFVIIAWVVMQFYWAAVITFLLFLIQDVSRRRLIILVYDDRIVYPSFPKRTVEWDEMNNVILKDGWLTIDLKSNKIFQNEVVSIVSETEFNEFCLARLNKAINPPNR